MVREAETLVGTSGSYDAKDWGFEDKSNGSAKSADRASAFEYIYAQNVWNGGSGPGSRIDGTKEVRCTLSELRAVYAMRSLFDIVGDFRWMRIWLARNPDVAYQGGDIVPQLAAAHQKKHGRSAAEGRGAWRFTHTDIVCSKKTPLRFPGTDVVLLREVLQHNIPADILQALRCVSSSGARWLLATNFPGWEVRLFGPPYNATHPRIIKLRSKNLAEDATSEDLDQWRWHAHDLTKPPYNLPQPERYFADEAKFLGLWRLPLPADAL